jgi:hypothetical protein
MIIVVGIKVPEFSSILFRMGWQYKPGCEEIVKFVLSFVHIDKIILERNIEGKKVYIEKGLRTKYGTWVQLQTIYP